MSEKKSKTDEWPKRDEITDEDGPHPSRDVPRDRANDARTSKGEQPSRDIDPDSAESMIDRDDTNDEA